MIPAIRLSQRERRLSVTDDQQVPVPGPEDAGPEPDAGRPREGEREGGQGAVRLWGARFASGPADALARLSVSVQFDWRLAPYDLLASAAHARVLHRAGLLDDGELSRMLTALEDLGRACREGSFRPDASDEDVHTALERGLLERLGSLGGKLRAGRSRNDQIATDLRLYLRDHVRTIVARLAELENALIGQAEQHLDTPVPGMTHLQHAQPVLLAHQLLAHVQAFARDASRLRDWDRRAAVSPLGAGALAGSSLPLDPEALAAELGFDSAFDNSMDAVSDRDFAAEFCFAAALLGVHLSRLGEEVALWSSHEFGWAQVDDAYATGSSIMPQKKNPDVAELARGKAGRLIGGLTGLLATLKSLPMTYNRDLQEDKEPVFDAVDTLLTVLPAVAGMMATLRFNTGLLARTAAAGHALATDLAELLVRRGTPFRQAHEIVGHLVVWCQVHDCELAEVGDEDLAKISPLLTPDVREVLTVEGALAARSSRGGTAPVAVAGQLGRLRITVDDQAEWAAG
jgi:argininosuccinate lyase